MIIPGCGELADGVLCQLEAVPRAALRLDAVTDYRRCRTRKVEPGNEQEGSRVPGTFSCQRAVALCGHLLFEAR